jgi:hypothetical protein
MRASCLTTSCELLPFGIPTEGRSRLLSYSEPEGRIECIQGTSRTIFNVEWDILHARQHCCGTRANRMERKC